MGPATMSCIPSWRPFKAAIATSQGIACSYFAALYLLLRILNNLSFVVFVHTPSLAVSCFLFILVILSLVLIAPYRRGAHNKIDILFFLGGTSAFPLDYLGSFLWPYSTHVHHVFKIFLALVVLIPVLYGITLFLRKVRPRKLQVALKRYCSIPTTCRRRSVEDLGYPYRYETENTPLLQ